MKKKYCITGCGAEVCAEEDAQQNFCVDCVRYAEVPQGPWSSRNRVRLFLTNKGAKALAMRIKALEDRVCGCSAEQLAPPGPPEGSMVEGSPPFRRRKL